MGRVKLKIKRLENTNGRQATYAKRKHGIMKKANELSILCDIDIILLMFSPTSKPSLCTGKRSIEEVIEKFSQQTPQERAKRKLESLEALRKTFKKLDHDVNIQDFLGTSSQTIEDLAGQAKFLRTQLSEVHQRLSYWGSPERINNTEHLTQMEDSLRESLHQVQAHKENLQKHPPLSLEFTNQMQNGMHIPFNMSVEQQLQLENFSWIASDGQNMVLHEDTNFMPHRDVECSASSSFASFPSYFGTGRSPELSNSGQENGILPELSRGEPLRPHLGGQNSCMSYNVNFLNDSRFQSAAEMNMPVNPVDYHINGNYDTTQHNWASSSGPCAISLLDDRLYPQL